MKKNNRYFCFLSCLMLIILFVSNGGTTGDACIYRETFEMQYLDKAGFEIGYVILGKLIYLFGVHTYIGFLITLLFFVSIFIFQAFKKLKISYHCLFSVLMPFIFPTYSVAIRFFVASAIMILALRYLLERKYYIFLLLLLLASSFHTISFFYIIFLLCIPFKKHSWKKRNIELWGVAIFVILYYLIVLLLNRNFLVEVIIKTIAVAFNVNPKKYGYASMRTNYGSLLFLFIYFWGLYLSFLQNKLLCKTVIEIKTFNDKFLLIYSRFNYNLNLVLSLVLPLLCTTLIFYRLLLVGHVSNAIVLGLLLKNRNTNRKDKLYRFVITVFVFSCISWFIPELIAINNITIKNLINSSLIFGSNILR